MKTKNSLGYYWWLILVAVVTLLLPVLLNFLVFSPTSQLSVGTLQDWMAFWGSYLAATLSSLAAFIILYIQRKDHHQEIESSKFENNIKNAKDRQKYLNDNARILKENQQENAKTRKILLDIFTQQQEVLWLSDLRIALVNYISAYRENEIKEVIDSIQESLYESIHQKLKKIYSTITLADTALNLIIIENSKTSIGDTYQKELAKLYARYISIINDIHHLACLYYKKEPISNEASNNLNHLLSAMCIDSKDMDYNQFSELACQIIKPLSTIFEAVITLSDSCIKEERQRIGSIMNSDYD